MEGRAHVRSPRENSLRSRYNEEPRCAGRTGIVNRYAMSKQAGTHRNLHSKGQAFLHQYQMLGEIVVGDNGSTDGSQEIATLMGARVVTIEAKGYGNALMGGITA